MIGVMLFTRQNFSFATMYQNQNGKEQRKMNKGIKKYKISIQAFEAFQNSSLRMSFRNIINVCIGTNNFLGGR